MTGPMSFAISAEQEALIDVASRFGERELAPYYKQREREGRYDSGTLRAMGALGLFGIELPEEFGGLGIDCTTAGLVLEAICRSDYNIGQLMVTMSLSGAVLAAHGDPDVVGPWLRGMTAGESIPAIALTEPGSGSDAASLTLRAVRDGDNYILDGEKNSVTFASQAQFAIVWARTGTVGSGARHQRDRVRRSRRPVRWPGCRLLRPGRRSAESPDRRGKPRIRAGHAGFRL